MLACAMMLVSWLTVYVPIGFSAGTPTVEMVVPVAGPPGAAPVRVSHLSLAVGDGTLTVDITVFDGAPPYPGGPMVTAEEKRVDVGGRPVDVYWTSMFMGTEQEVAVAYPTNAAGAGSAMVVIRGVPFDEALEIVPTILSGC